MRDLTCDVCDHTGPDVVREWDPENGDMSDACADRGACWRRLSAANEAALREQESAPADDSDIPW